MTFFPGLTRQIQPSISLAELDIPADVKERLTNIVADLQARESGPTVALFVADDPSTASAAAEALAHAMNKNLVQVNVRGDKSDAAANPKVNLQQAVQTLDARQVILFFDEADSLFRKRTAVSGDEEAASDDSDTSLTPPAWSKFEGFSIVFSHAMPETAIENLRYTVRFPARTS